MSNYNKPLFENQADIVMKAVMNYCIDRKLEKNER